MQVFRKYLLVIVLCFITQIGFTQIDGDNIFSESQIIRIDLSFSQEGFWDSLTQNYTTSTYMRADLILTDQTGTYTFEDVGVRLKGNSSYSHPGVKKSFKIDFNEYTSGQNYDGLKKLNFSNAFKDPTLMREKVFFDVCRAAGVPAPRANFANVYFNNTLWGFYTVIEQIDDQFLDWRILDDDGNLFKAGDNFGGGPGGGGNEADLVYYGDNQSLYEERYELKSNEEENDWSDLIEFMDFINNASDSELESALEDHLELTEYLRSVALDNLFSNLDSYTGSARNYYLYHNLTTDKWEWIKWDGNECFGTYGGGGLDLTSLAPNYHSNDRPLLEKIFNNPNLYNRYLEELCDIQDSYFNPTYLNAQIDAHQALIQSSVFADNNKMYTDANFEDNIESNIMLGGGPGPGGGTVFGLKSFVNSKYNYISNAIDCALFTNAEELVNNEAIKLYPNPTSLEIKIAWGEIEIQQIKLFNAIGQILYEEYVPNQAELSLDVSGFENGFYFVSLYTEDQQINKEIIIQKD